MAQVTFNVAANMATAQIWYGTVTGATSTRITITDGSNTAIYTGSFSYTFNDVFGTLTGYSGYVGSTLAVSISDLSYDAHTAYVYLQSNAQQQLLESALAGGDTIFGSGSTDVLMSYAGDDQVRAGAGNDNIDGGAGFDTSLYSNASSKYEITVSGGALTVRDRTGLDGMDTLSNVERITFSNTSIDSASFIKTALLTKVEIDSLAEIYIASFNRAPDALGLDYWGAQLKDGMSLEAIAKSFFVQPETAAKYPPSTTNESFATTVYGNVLGRTPDPEGLKYWVGQLDQGFSRDKFLIAILNGAHANPDATLDIANLNNKVVVGEHFALAKGLSNGTWSQQVMAGVTSDASTVTAANTLTDNFAALAEASGTSELVVKILGIVS